MVFFCSDLEGVWVPEVWVNVARITGIEELKLTTRDISDYDVLMKHRIKILKETQHHIKRYPRCYFENRTIARGIGNAG